jgi:DtxR family transcriptional regulator, Mn-dependent transcriptional regulator
VSTSKDNYLKTIYSLSRGAGEFVSTNDIASKLNSKPSSATDMIKKLDKLGWVTYKKYHGVCLTPEGKKIALDIIRRHRIWEVFLSDKLGFAWNEVHDLAEQLEHIKSEELISRLEEFLRYPKFDPHGDPIPDAVGRIPKQAQSSSLNHFAAGDKVKIVSVDDSSSSMLIYLMKNKIVPGEEIIIKKCFDFDHSMQVKSKSGMMMITQKIASCIQAQKLKP